MTTQNLPAATSPLGLDVWWLGATCSVALAVFLASVFSPDMVTGAPQEQLALPAILDWMWGAVAIGYLAAAGPGRSDPTLAVTVAVVWFAVAGTSIFAPSLVTGTDPTSIPIAALVAPVVGAIITGFLSLAALRRITDR